MQVNTLQTLQRPHRVAVGVDKVKDQLK